MRRSGSGGSPPPHLSRRCPGWGWSRTGCTAAGRQSRRRRPPAAGCKRCLRAGSPVRAVPPDQPTRGAVDREPHGRHAGASGLTLATCSAAAQYCNWSGGGPSGRHEPSLLNCPTTEAGHSGSQQQFGVHAPMNALHVQLPVTDRPSPAVAGTVAQSIAYLLRASWASARGARRHSAVRRTAAVSARACVRAIPDASGRTPQSYGTIIILPNRSASDAWQLRPTGAAMAGHSRPAKCTGTE